VLCPPQTPHAAWMWTRAVAVGSQPSNHLSVWAVWWAICLRI
jgi:hypothetical protein